MSLVMAKFVAASLLAAMVLAALSACESNPPPVSEVVDNTLPSIVEIRAESGTGTGFIVSKSGLVVTNRHVVERDERVIVRVATGEIYLGHVVRTHATLDIAYIEIEADREFVPIPMGDSDDVPLGAGVIAIGFPLGSGNLAGSRPLPME